MSLRDKLTTSVLYYVEYHSGGWIRDPYMAIAPEQLWDIYKAYRDEHVFVRIVKVVATVAKSKTAEFKERYGGVQ